MRYRIDAIVQHGQHVKEFRLVPADGSAAPPWLAGAHIELVIEAEGGREHRNRYSLVGVPGPQLRIAVQREQNGHGGSRALHERYQAGMEIEASAPREDFRLHQGALRNVLLAGGIGITPMLSMACALDAAGAAFELHYLARERERMVLLDELAALRHGRIERYATGTDGRPALGDLIGRWSEGSELHACGPAPLLQAIRAVVASQGWPAANVHVESFGARSAAGDRLLRVHLRQSDIKVDVQPGTPILDALIAADAFVSYDCRRGECGNCFAPVLAGRPLHRDVCLTPAQRAEGMTTCVSWAEGDELVLDL